MDLTIPVGPVTHHTFVIERSYPATPETLFSAFADPARKRRWFVEDGGHEPEEFTMDFRVGGNELARFRLKKGGPYGGIALTNESVFQDIVPNRRIVMSSSMTVGDRRISASLTTFEFLAVEQGASLIFTHQGAFLEGADGPQLREAGWRQLLEQLAGGLSRRTDGAS